MGLLSHYRLRLRALILPALLALVSGAAFLMLRSVVPARPGLGDRRGRAEWLQPQESSPGTQAASISSGAPPGVQEEVTPESSQAGHSRLGPRPGEGNVPMTRKQQQERLKSEFEKMKRDAAELTTLAQLLQEDLEKSSEHILSMKVVEKAQKIESLAKRISRTARSY